MLGGVEAGGTKFLCVMGPDPLTVLHRAEIPTGDPIATLAAIAGFFEAGVAARGALAALGIGSFGPLDLDPASPNFGAITRTPKPGWSGINLRASLAATLNCRVAIDTDVNTSGIAEAAIGAGRGVDTVAYVTVGTGIGGGLIVQGVPLHGLTHPEMGHIRPIRHPLDMDFPGSCPFHADCLEGLASGSAIQARLGKNLSELPPGDPLHAIIADYLGQFCATLVLMGSPQRIVLGGGVMASNPGLFPPIREAMLRWLGGYIHAEALEAGVESFIVPPALGPHAGITGALMLAQQASGYMPSARL